MNDFDYPQLSEAMTHINFTMVWDKLVMQGFLIILVYREYAAPDLTFLFIHIRLKALVYTEKLSYSWDISDGMPVMHNGITIFSQTRNRSWVGNNEDLDRTDKAYGLHFLVASWASWED